eukprot:COSAG01_NODE_372_length_17995_cov_16.957812_4_plen_77_part_00
MCIAQMVRTQPSTQALQRRGGGGRTARDEATVWLQSLLQAAGDSCHTHTGVHCGWRRAAARRRALGIPTVHVDLKP